MTPRPTYRSLAMRFIATSARVYVTFEHAVDARLTTERAVGFERRPHHIGHRCGPLTFQSLPGIGR